MQRLKNIFKNAARDNTLMRCFINNSQRVASIAYLATDITLLSKHGTNVNLETLSGAFFLASTAMLWKAQKNPLYMKIAGILTMGGALSLGAAGFGGPGAIEQASCAVPVLITAYLMTRTATELKINNNKAQTGFLHRKFNRAKGFIRNNPLLSGGLIDFPGGILLAMAAVKQDDPLLGLAAATWVIGSAALSASDPNIKKLAKPIL